MSETEELPDELPELPAGGLFARIKIEEIKDEELTFEFSAILDDETCSACRSADGLTSNDLNKLPTAPHPQCSNPQGCRCMLIEITD